MIVMREKENENLNDRLSIESEYLLFRAMCKLFGFRRPLVTKNQFISIQKQRREIMNRAIKRMESV